MQHRGLWFMLGIVIGSLLVVSVYSVERITQHESIPPSKIDNTVPVYYIGDSVSGYFLSAKKVTEFRKISAPHILIVNGSFADDNGQIKQFIKEEVLSGIPVIVTNNPELLRDIFKDQFYPRIVGGQGPDGKPLGKEKVYGYVTYPLPSGGLATKVFISVDPAPKGIREAYNWALKNLHQKQDL